MSRIKLLSSYEGTHYFGWQKTKMGPSIEEEMEKALSQILQETVELEAASRTDRGVHAEGQVVCFSTQKKLDPFRIQKGLNALLPKDISILEASEVADDFHPTLDNVAKEYHYEVCLGDIQLPFHRNFSWHFFYPLELGTMKEASQFFLGKHDFSAFCNMRLFLQSDKIRTIYSLEIIPLPQNRLRISIIGDRFLYKMVRNIVGTLLYVGCGKLTLEQIPLILENKDRKEAGMTAPAHGLFLKKVFYELPGFIHADLVHCGVLS